MGDADVLVLHIRSPAIRSSDAFGSVYANRELIVEIPVH